MMNIYFEENSDFKQYVCLNQSQKKIRDPVYFLLENIFFDGEMDLKD